MEKGKPRCPTCKHFNRGATENGICEKDPVESQIKPGNRSENDPLVILVRNLPPDYGCSFHQDFELWAKSNHDSKQKDWAAASNLNADIMTFKGPYNCPCVLMQKPRNEEWNLIVHEGRNLSANSRCKHCHGKGIASHASLANQEEPRNPLFAGYAPDPEDGSMVEVNSPETRHAT